MYIPTQFRMLGVLSAVLCAGYEWEAKSCQKALGTYTWALAKQCEFEYDEMPLL